MNEITFATEFEVALRSLAALEDEAKDAQKRRDEARAELYKAMEVNDLKCVDTEYIKLTRVDPTVSIVPDWKSFKFEEPKKYEKIFNKYNMEKKRSGYVKITTK